MYYSASRQFHTNRNPLALRPAPIFRQQWAVIKKICKCLGQALTNFGKVLRKAIDSEFPGKLAVVKSQDQLPCVHLALVLQQVRHADSQLVRKTDVAESALVLP